MLQLYKSDVDEKDLIAIKKLISDYLAAKAIAMADEIWDKGGWDSKKIEELLHAKMRTPYNHHTLTNST